MANPPSSSDEREASQLPPLAAAAQAALLQRGASSSAWSPPYAADGLEMLSLSDSDDYSDDSEPPSPPPPGKGKAPALSRLRRRRRRRARTSILMDDARRTGAASPPPQARRAREPSPPPASPPQRQGQLRSVVVHPPRLSSEVDEDGFRIVESRRRWRRRPVRPAPTPRPVPPELVGLCFNCLAPDHVAAHCRFPSRCLHCRDTGHRARMCKRARSPRRDAPPTRGRPRVRLDRLHRRSTTVKDNVDTDSARSASTGRETSVPRSCRPPTPEEPTPSRS